jgi:peptidyl-prolyl cis-trans isomerase D
MFDLFRSRAKAVRYLLGAVLILVALSMVITLIPGFGSGPVQQETMVAEVGEDVVTLRDVQLAIQNVQRGRSVPQNLIQHFIPQLVEELITERAVAYQARRMGIEVSDSDIAHAVNEMAPQLFQGGQFAGRDIYAAFLAQQNLTIPEFEASVARQVLSNRLRSMALQGVVVSPQEVEQAYRERNEKARIEHVSISPEKLRSQVQVTPEEVKEEFERARSTYRIPEKRNLALVVIDQADVEARVSVSESELQQAYNQEQERFRTPDRVKVRHILLNTTDKPKEEDAKIKAKADSLLKQLRAGADFAELAKKNSEDPVSRDKGGDLDWVVRGQTVPEFENAAFALKPKQISEVVKTQYGYHILQVLDREQARLRPFEEVKTELATELKRQRVAGEMERLADTTQAELRKNPNPEQVASALKLRVVRVEKVGPGDPIPEVGANQEFNEVVFGSKTGDATPPVAVSPTRFVLAVVTDIFPAHPAELNEVETQIRNTLLNRKIGALAQKRAEDLAAKAKSMNGDLRKAAQSMGLETRTSAEFTRNGAVEGLGSGAFLQNAFTEPVGTVVGPLGASNGLVVYKVTAKTPADLAGLAGERDSIRDELKSRKARERNALFEDSVKEALRREGKIKIYQDTVERLIGNYRG